MNVHKNARLTPKGREPLIERGFAGPVLGTFGIKAGERWPLLQENLRTGGE